MANDRTGCWRHGRSVTLIKSSRQSNYWWNLSVSILIKYEELKNYSKNILKIINKRNVRVNTGKHLLHENNVKDSNSGGVLFYVQARHWNVIWEIQLYVFKPHHHSTVVWYCNITLNNLVVCLVLQFMLQSTPLGNVPPAGWRHVVWRFVIFFFFCTMLHELGKVAL